MILTALEHAMGGKIERAFPDWQYQEQRRCQSIALLEAEEASYDLTVEW
jgi:hypothetical protein